MRKSPLVLLTILLTVLCVLIGLISPFFVSFAQDAALENAHIPLSQDTHYTYRGTLLNRVLAYNAHLNASPAVEDSTLVSGFVPPQLLTQLIEFLPLDEAISLTASNTLVLTPTQYNAEYFFTQSEFQSTDKTMHVTIDAETLLPIRIELRTSPEIMTEYAQSNSMWHILKSYGKALNLGEVADDGSTIISEILCSEKNSLRGVPFSVSITIVPASGTLLLKLEGVPSV